MCVYIHICVKKIIKNDEVVVVRENVFNTSYITFYYLLTANYLVLIPIDYTILVIELLDPIVYWMSNI